jgi:hypothetical protein
MTLLAWLRDMMNRDPLVRRIVTGSSIGKIRASLAGIGILCVGALMLNGCQTNCRGVVFPPGATSEYALPYPAGNSYTVSQSYCNPLDGHRNRIAVDFAMPMGAQIVAARGGTVLEVVTHFEDGDLQRGHNNRVLIRHKDSTIAWYAHLQHNSITVAVDDIVATGEVIASCGNTGNTGNLPHLHFEVFKTRPYDYEDALPVSFSNAKGRLDSRGGLIAGESYEAILK